MILVGRNFSPYVRRVAVTLHLLQVSYEQRPLSAVNDQLELRKYNPLGRVPALILDNGDTLVDSAAIIDFLACTYGNDRVLMPNCGPERQSAMQSLALVDGAVQKIAAAIYEKTRRPPEKVHQPWLEHCMQQAAGGLAAVEARLQEDWLAGRAMTQADIFAAVAVRFIKLAAKDLLAIEQYSRLIRLSLRCEEIPAFQATAVEL